MEMIYSSNNQRGALRTPFLWLLALLWEPYSATLQIRGQRAISPLSTVCSAIYMYISSLQGNVDVFLYSLSILSYRVLGRTNRRFRSNVSAYA